jgi:sulfatase maturation enzyme AslB (radical SAM superfamily)
LYFTGGEPLIAPDHWRLLQELIDSKQAKNISLMYNSNLTTIRYKDINIQDLWSQFRHVKINCSIDAVGKPLEYIRSGTDWQQIENNLKLLKQFKHISITLTPVISILNFWFLPEFLKYAKNQKLVVNPIILQGPDYYRIDMLPLHLKEKFKKEFEEHIRWLEPIDTIHRAVGGFKGAIEFMMATDNSHLLPRFWEQTTDLDWSRKESLISVVPELEEIKNYLDSIGYVMESRESRHARR